MKRALFCLIAFAPMAQAKMQFMSCKTTRSETVFKKVEGNVDRDGGKSGSLLVTSTVNGKVKDGDMVNARDIKLVKSAEGDQLVSEWMHDFTLALPVGGSEEGKLDLDSQNGLVAHDAIKCTFKDEDPERLEGRELCFQHQRFCREFKNFPKANEKELFLAKAKEFEKNDPGVAFRRVLTCKGTQRMTKTDFTILGSLNDEKYLIGTFLVKARTAGRPQEQFRIYKVKDLTFDWNDDVKGMDIRTEDSEKFLLTYKKEGPEAMIRGEDSGMTQSFSGPLQCTLTKVSRDELASHEQCLKNFLGCEAFKSISRNPPGPEDLDTLKAMQQQAASVLRRNSDR